MARQCTNEVDPVCGMVLKDCNVVETAEFESKTYGFCSTKCRSLFKGNPKKYIDNPSPRKMMPGHKEIPEKH